MNIYELKRFIKDLPNDMEVLVSVHPDQEPGEGFYFEEQENELVINVEI